MYGADQRGWPGGLLVQFQGGVDLAEHLLGAGHRDEDLGQVAAVGVGELVAGLLKFIEGRLGLVALDQEHAFQVAVSGGGLDAPLDVSGEAAVLTDQGLGLVETVEVQQQRGEIPGQVGVDAAGELQSAPPAGDGRVSVALGQVDLSLDHLAPDRLAGLLEARSK